MDVVGLGVGLRCRIVGDFRDGGLSVLAFLAQAEEENAGNDCSY